MLVGFVNFFFLWLCCFLMVGGGGDVSGRLGRFYGWLIGCEVS